MKETLAQLIELQRTDDSIVSLEQRIGDLDQQLGGARAALDAATATLDAAHHTRQEAQAATHRKEIDLAEAEAGIRKLEGQLNMASTNKEFQAIQTKMGTIKAENGRREEGILLAMDDVEEKERLEDAARAAQREAEAALRTAEGQVEEQRQGLLDEVVEVRTAREELAASINPQKLTLYERIRAGNRRSGSAVVAVHGEYCQGCQMAVLSQDFADLVSAAKVVLCRSCQRILVLEE